MGGNEPFMGPLVLFGGIGLVTGALLTAGVTLFVFRDMSAADVHSATPTARPAGVTLLREFGGTINTPTVVAVAQANPTRPALGSALAGLAEQDAPQRDAADAPAPAAAPQPAALPAPIARPAPPAQL